MKRILRIENLLIAPLLLLFCVGAFLYLNDFVNKKLEDWSSLFILLTMFSSFTWLSILLPAYLIHYMLRAIKQRNRLLCIAHVILSLALIATLYWKGDFATSMVPGWHTTIYPPLSGLGMIGYGWPNVLFAVLQATFIIYGIVVIRRWKKTRT